jgi:hypothetical protein
VVQPSRGAGLEFRLQAVCGPAKTACRQNANPGNAVRQIGAQPPRGQAVCWGMRLGGCGKAMSATMTDGRYRALGEGGLLG